MIMKDLKGMKDMKKKRLFTFFKALKPFMLMLCLTPRATSR
jgi:hypothetical protein